MYIMVNRVESIIIHY